MFDSQRFQAEKKLQDWIQALDEFLFLEILQIKWIEISQLLFDYIWLEQKQAILWLCDSGKIQTHTIDRMSEWEHHQAICSLDLQKCRDDMLTVQLHILQFKTSEFIFVEQEQTIWTKYISILFSTVLSRQICEQQIETLDEFFQETQLDNHLILEVCEANSSLRKSDEMNQNLFHISTKWKVCIDYHKKKAPKWCFFL